MGGERLLQVRLDEGRTAERPPKATRPRCSGLNPHCRVSELTALGRAPAAFHARVLEAFKQSGPLPDQVLETAVE